jgi:DNA-binding response OmpR family regulator
VTVPNPSSAPTHVLVVEDEPNIRELVCLHLGLEGYACDGVGEGRSALLRLKAERFDLLVLDVMIPGIDGLSLCRAVRNGEINQDIPILMLTARRDETDRVVGLEAGADDYLTKPFGVRELVARSRALLRRPRRPAVQEARDDEGLEPIRVHAVEIDPPRRRVRVDGRDAGIVFSREALLAKIWRGGTYVTVRSVDTLIKRLRRRVEPNPREPRYLLTVWGVGYKFVDG